ncbi:MAG: hypothetical protein SH817_05140 [Leptospira sp.]|nr:hypothetical protein [Leptospira sp.]
MVHVTEFPSEDFLSQFDKLGFAIGTPWIEGEFITSEMNLVEWGQYHDLNSPYLIPNEGKIEYSKYLNSKLVQRQWKEDFSLSPLKSKLISSEDLLIDYLNECQRPIVLKGAYGIAGRNHIIIESPSQGWKLQQIPKKLYNYPVFCEEWVGKDRIFDFSTLWDFTESGPSFLGITEMLVEADGSFRGIRMSANIEQRLVHILPDCLQIMKSILDASEFKPIGPAAMDGFLYKVNHELRVQNFSEINFRYSIGRILFEIRKYKNLRMLESGLLFLPLNQIKKFNEKEWLSVVKKETGAEVFFVTPTKDAKGKYFQNVGLYYEEKQNSQQSNELVTWLGEAWRNLIIN